MYSCGLLWWLDSNILHVCRMFSSFFYITTFPHFISLGLFSFSLVLRPHSKIGKRAWSHLQTSRMYCVSTLFGVDKSCSPITFLTHEGSMLIPRPKWNLHRKPGLIHHMICATGCVFMSPGKNFLLCVTLEAETSQARTIDYGCKLTYEELNPWFDLETRCGQV